MTRALDEMTNQEVVNAARRLWRQSKDWEKSGARMFAESSERGARRYEGELWDRGLDSEGNPLEGRALWFRLYGVYLLAFGVPVSILILVTIPIWLTL